MQGSVLSPVSPRSASPLPALHMEYAVDLFAAPSEATHNPKRKPPVRQF